MKIGVFLGILFLFSHSSVAAQCHPSTLFDPPSRDVCLTTRAEEKGAFIDTLLSRLTVPELAHQLHLVFADNVIGPSSRNELYESYVGDRGIGLIHDWYPTNRTQYNELQKLNLQRSRVPILFLQTGECLHGVGSFKQTMFPSPIGLAASWDPDLVYRVGRAIGSEARSIGIGACFSPVLDLGKEPRWGRVQEDFGEDVYLTTIMGVAYASGLSKNGSWSDPDAVIPVMKHFAAHGSPQGGVNAAPYMGYGRRQLLSEMLVPFKAAVELGGVRGVMMAYHDIDGVPSVVNPDLYDALKSWNFDGFVIGDDTAISELQGRHLVASTPADALAQWFDAGGGVQYYDYPLSLFESTVSALVENGTVDESTLRSRVRGVLSAKYDLGLFDDPYIGSDVSPEALTAAHEPIALDAARRSIVLLENRGDILPLRLTAQNIETIALVGPMADTLNYGDYSGPWGANPVAKGITVRAGMERYLTENASDVQLVTSWGCNTWLYNGQYPIPADLLFTPNGTSGGLLATYFADTDFSQPAFQKIEAPNLGWGIYPPNGLPSNNFSAVWEGQFRVPSDAQGWLGIAVGPNSTATVFVDGQLFVTAPLTTSGNFLGNIPSLAYSLANATAPPLGSRAFVFKAKENVNNLNAQIQLFWNLVDREDAIGRAADAAKRSDVVIFVGAAAWNSDGESGDRATMGLSANQTQLLDELFKLDKPVVMILEGGRPFTIPEYYSKAIAVLLAYFPGQSGGHALTDVLFGLSNPTARLPLSIPSSVGALPTYYNYKPSARGVNYADLLPPYASYAFGFGLSYTRFAFSDFTTDRETFTASDRITFRLSVTNAGPRRGSAVPHLPPPARIQRRPAHPTTRRL